jgi:prophage regulatory protein
MSAICRSSLHLPQVGLVRLATILTHFQISRSGWYQGVKDGKYPKPIKAGNVSFWRAEDIHAVIEKTINGMGA